MSEPKSIKEANDRLAALGEKRRVFRTLESAKLAVSQAEGKKPKFPHQAPPAGPKPFKPFAESVEDMKAAAKAERDPSKKVDAFEKLAARLESDLKAESDMVKQTNIRRELVSAQKSVAYARLAEKAANPNAVDVRRYMDAADRD